MRLEPKYEYTRGGLELVIHYPLYSMTTNVSVWVIINSNDIIIILVFFKVDFIILTFD